MYFCPRAVLKTSLKNFSLFPDSISVLSLSSQESAQIGQHFTARGLYIEVRGQEPPPRRLFVYTAYHISLVHTRRHITAARRERRERRGRERRERGERARPAGRRTSHTQEKVLLSLSSDSGAIQKATHARPAHTEIDSPDSLSSLHKQGAGKRPDHVCVSTRGQRRKRAF